MLKLGNNKTHLKAPVAKMNITDNLISVESADPLDALAYNCRTKVTYMKRLCYVCSAVINNHGFPCACFIYTKISIFSHLLGIGCKIRRA